MAAPAPPERNLLYYGDNLKILRRYVKDETADLIYLDPPFNSNQNYNLLFREQDGSRAASQIHAFEDTWHWDRQASDAFDELVTTGPDRVSRTMQGLRLAIGDTDMLAYLAMMALRLIELHRVLKPTGSLYLHCDPNASHYLKLLLDSVFGPGRFRNEVIWKRTSAHNSAKRFGPVHDTLFFYTKTDCYTWNPSFQPLPQETIDAWYNNVEPGTGRRYNRADLTAPGVRTGDSAVTWRGVAPTLKGRHWAIPGFVGKVVAGKATYEALEALDAAGRIHWPKKAGGMPMLKRYVEEATGVPAQDVIADISPLNNATAERLGYPTQKPEALLERLIKASSNDGDVVLDAFCGCGTAVSVAQRLSRSWVGIDVTYLAIGIIRNRLHEAHGKAVEQTYRVVGEPESINDAAVLAKDDRFEFQRWIISRLLGRPVEKQTGKDKGIDGRIYFHDGPESDRVQHTTISVKSGATGPTDVRDLLGVVSRDKGAIGVLVTLNDPTRDMRKDALAAGYYESAGWRTKYPRIQLMTVEEILAGGDKIKMPPVRQTSTTFKRSPKAGKASLLEQESLPFGHTSADDE